MSHPSKPPTGRPCSRRKFLTTSLTAGAAMAVLPVRPLRGQAPAGASAPEFPKLNIAFIGIGHQGGDMVKTFTNTGLVNVVALCDVDLLAAHTLEARNLHPSVPTFQDYRELFERMGDKFEAVVIATPDHSHFPLAMHAMRHGKHVYVEKPLAHTFREVELLMAMAAKSGVVTQMGNQGHSGNNFHQFKAWTEAGVIKDVTRIVAHMNSPRRWHGWQVDGFEQGAPVPPTINWDLWNMTRPVRPYSDKLHPLTWRGWFHYGNGAFGDWGPHLLDTAHRFLELGLPHTIEAVRRDGANEFIFPQASTIRFDFAARRALPACEVFWYDGVENLPPIPAELGPGADLTKKNGKFIFSRTLAFQGGSHGDTLRIIPEEKMRAMARDLPRIGSGFSDHYVNFVRACRGLEETRSPFRISGPLSQVFLLGVIAQRLGGKLRFDAATGRFVDHAGANELLDGPPPRPGWEHYYRA